MYVCDRMNHRLQVFQKNGSFVTEGFIGRQTAGASVWDIDFSPDAEQSFVYNADGGNHRLWMVQREGLETIDTLGRRGPRPRRGPSLALSEGHPSSDGGSLASFQSFNLPACSERLNSCITVLTISTVLGCSACCGSARPLMISPCRRFATAP